MDRKTKATGFYREDAARIVSEAARLPAGPAVVEPTPTTPVPSAPPPAEAPAAPAIVLDEPARPPLAPEPAINQNVRASRPAPVAREPQPISIGRIIAWIVLAPWYLAMIAAAVGIDALFVKDLFGF